MVEVENLPEVRFKGFSGAWVEKYIHEIANRYDNLRIPISASNRVPGSTPYYGANGIQGYIDGYTHDGEFILLAEDGANDLKNYPVIHVNGKVWVNNHAHVLQGIEGKLNNLFLKSAFSKVNFEPFLVGGGRAKLNAEVMMGINLNIPQSTAQQIQIGTFFKNLDDQITLKQRKLDKLVTLKKAMLEKMFPKDGADEPEIRFKGFSGKWKKINLDSIFRKIRNAFVGTATPYYVKEGHFYLESNNVKDGRINRKNEVFINEEFYYKQSDKWLREGDIVMVQSGHVGHTAVIPPELNNTAAHALIMFTDPKEEVCPHYLNFQFQTENIKEKLSVITTGNTIKHILSSEMKEFEMFFTDTDEQIAIGSYFQKLDNLISLQKTELTKLKQIKSSYLEKMFV